MGRTPNITKSVSTQMLVVRLMLVYCIQLIFVYQTHARIARKFMALEIAMSKLADPFNYASFLNENKLGKETEVQGVQTERPLARITRAASRKASNSKLLILDLNGVILAKNSNDRYDFKFRPYTHEFLKFCFSCFNVAIWSSKQWHNVQRVIKNLPHFKWEFVWVRLHLSLSEFVESVS
nr:uncharacterized FCP1 homology domain-containing protein C1271.03c-like isoform X1 [Coffea arabica]